MRTNINDVAPMDEFKVQFFNLKDGEKAIVRFLIQDENDFDVITLHTVDIGDNKTVRVDCIRDPRQPVHSCPLCEAGEKIDQRAFIKLVQYVKASDGSYVPKAKIWDRSVRSSLITSLKNYLNDYGPLTDIVCSVTRNGAGLDTTYTVAPNLPNPQNYPVDFSDFDGYDVIGTIIKSWDAAQMANFLNTGEIPSKSSTDQNAPTSQPAYVAPSTYESAPAYQQPAYEAQAPTTNVQRPRRVYNA